MIANAPNTMRKFNHILQVVYQMLFSLPEYGKLKFPRQSYEIIHKKCNFI